MFNVALCVCDSCCDLGGSGNGSEPMEEVGIGSCSLSVIEAHGMTMTGVPGKDHPIDFVIVSISMECLRSRIEGALMVDDLLGIVCAKTLEQGLLVLSTMQQI